MNTPIAFNSNVCFTGAPASGLEQMATAIHTLAEATTNCGIPFFDQKVWLDPESALLGDRLENAQKLLLVADTFLGLHGPRGEEPCFYLVRGPLDVMALARVQNVTLPLDFAKTCSRLLERVRLLAFQLPDQDAWRVQGFDRRRAAWLMNYTRTLFEIAREHGLRLEQLRVLPAQCGDANASLVEASWRIFGVGLNPLRPTVITKPIASVVRAYETQCREIFEGRSGTAFGIPHSV